MSIIPRKSNFSRRKSSSTISSSSVNTTAFDINEFTKYAKGQIFNPLYGTGFWANPLWMNAIIKDLTMSPHKYDRDTVLKLIENPQNNEKALKDLHQYLLNTSQHYKRVFYYFATILTFDYILVPTNADEEDVKTPSFKRSLKKVLNWLEKFNLKEEFLKIMPVVIGEDVGFYYLRESETAITLQRMPTDYCKIVAKTDLGYQYAFNMVYFMRPGVNIDDFAPEFKIYWEEFINGDSSVPFFWKILEPEKAYVFKWDENDAGILLPLLGLFLDALEISEFKSLIKSKMQLENWKILFQRIPMKDSKDAKQNEFLIDGKFAGMYHANVKSELPPGVSVVTSPMEITGISLDHAENRDTIVGLGEHNFYSSAGASPLLFGGAVKSAVGVNMGIKVDEAFVLHMYRQFERFINYQLKQISGKYRFKIIFPDITIFNREDKLKSYLNAAQFGYSKSLVAAASGLTPNEFYNLLNYENGLGLLDKLQPLISAHTTTLTDKGRPQLPDSQIGDKADESRTLKT